jgi:peptide/nickel transport system substrate-binding protein
MPLASLPRRAVPAAALLALATALAACSSGSSGGTSGNSGSSSQPFVVANTSSVQKLDPQIATNFLDLQALGLIYQPLVTINSSLQVVPDLATKWAFSNGSKTLTFTLRQGVKFDDGSTLTSADVKASLERALNPKTAAAAASNIATSSRSPPRTRRPWCSTSRTRTSRSCTG